MINAIVFDNNRDYIVREISSRGLLDVVLPNGLTLRHNSDTIAPHRTTLLFVDCSLSILKNLQISNLADVGTGSGIIGLSIAKRIPKLNLLASDIKKGILRVVQHNASVNSIENIELFLNKDGVWLSEYDCDIDFIVANPPFVGKKEYSNKELLERHPEIMLEPVHAIRTNDDEGIEPYIDIFLNSQKLNTKYFLFYCNSSNVDRLENFYKGRHCRTKSYKGACGSDRFLFIER